MSLSYTHVAIFYSQVTIYKLVINSDYTVIQENVVVGSKAQHETTVLATIVLLSNYKAAPGHNASKDNNVLA